MDQQQDVDEQEYEMEVIDEDLLRQNQENEEQIEMIGKQGEDVFKDIGVQNDLNLLFDEDPNIQQPTGPLIREEMKTRIYYWSRKGPKDPEER